MQRGVRLSGRHDLGRAGQQLHRGWGVGDGPQERKLRHARPGAVTCPAGGPAYPMQSLRGAARRRLLVQDRAYGQRPDEPAGGGGAGRSAFGQRLARGRPQLAQGRLRGRHQRDARPASALGPHGPCTAAVLLPDRSRGDDRVFAGDPVSGEGRHSGEPETRERGPEQAAGGQRPSFSNPGQDFFPRLIDPAQDASLAPLRRIACKMATGSGKTVVMSMVVAWAFCNRGQNPATTLFPNGVLICCPNLTVKERLQVLRPERLDNYYEAFDIVPLKYRSLLQSGKVLVTHWHRFAPESEHSENGKNYAVVNKGPETPDTFARRVLEDLYDRLPIMVMNDEGHHCWRPAATEEDLATVEKDEIEEARVWLDGLDRINNCTANPAAKPGISICLDLSATPFYLKGSGHPEGSPFPWIVSDFGLVDAIESGIVKIPRLPVMDTTGRPDPKYFKLWKAINENLEPGERLPGKSKRPKPEVIYSKAEGALLQIEI